MTKRTAFFLASVSVSTWIACSSTGADASSTQSAQTIGTGGGTISSADKTLDITIPEGALDGDTRVTVTTIASDAKGIGAVFDIGPSGTKFKRPVTLSFNYAGASLGSTDPGSLRAATRLNGAWQVLADPVWSNGKVSGTTTHLSEYGIVSEANADAICTEISVGTYAPPNAGAPNGTATPPPGSGTSSSSSSGGSGGGGGAPPKPATRPNDPVSTPSCAALQAGCPIGTTPQDCVETATTARVSCCAAPAAEICFHSGAGVATPPDARPGGGNLPQPTTTTITCNDAMCPTGASKKNCSVTNNVVTFDCCQPAKDALRPVGAPTGSTNGAVDSAPPSASASAGTGSGSAPH